MKLGDPTILKNCIKKTFGGKLYELLSLSKHILTDSLIAIKNFFTQAEKRWLVLGLAKDILCSKENLGFFGWHMYAPVSPPWTGDGKIFQQFNQVNNHLQTQQTELGGLLLGSVFSRSGLTDGISIISILNSIPSDQYEATGASLVMSPSVWQKASLETSNDKFVVGWYHSHPNLGAFFSGTDRTTQDRFFSNPYSIGLVVDPIRNEAAWFRGKDSVEHPDESICVVRDGLALV